MAERLTESLTAREETILTTCLKDATFDDAISIMRHTFGDTGARELAGFILDAVPAVEVKPVQQPGSNVSRARADEIAEECEDAYSFDRYSASGWRASARLCAQKGFNEEQIEWILRSKWMRWAADHSDNDYGRHTSVSWRRSDREAHRVNGLVTICSRGQMNAKYIAPSSR